VSPVHRQRDDATPGPGAKADLERVAAAVGAPDLILPWLDRFYDEEDAALVLAASGAEPAGGAAAFAVSDAARLDRAVRRAVLDRDEAGAYSPSSFHDRLEFWAMLEGWKDVPADIHRQLAEWDVAFYAERIRPGVEALRDGVAPADPADAQGDYTYVLLDEGEAILAAQEHIYLWPCDCRSIIGQCRKPMYACLRFDNDRGVGWEISRERAVAILRETDKAGLMHTADYCGDPATAGAICNCCTDCCYPHLATDRLGTRDVWPVRRYVAAIDEDACTACGTCAQRCPFAAITSGEDKRPRLEPSACRGCGLCATGCADEAIAMQPLGSAA
jgi:Pyruvate/2-oxoacid:ferredoxin oxidoreductase delta subunit